jgi:hypothetical protein
MEWLAPFVLETNGGKPLYQPDWFVWKFTKTGVFTVKSMYLDLMNEDT